MLTTKSSSHGCWPNWWAHGLLTTELIPLLDSWPEEIRIDLLCKANGSNVALCRVKKLLYLAKINESNSMNGRLVPTTDQPCCEPVKLNLFPNEIDKEIQLETIPMGKGRILNLQQRRRIGDNTNEWISLFDCEKSAKFCKEVQFFCRLFL